MTPLQLQAKKTALVLIDLQHGIVNMAPNGGAAVIEQAAQLARRFRALGAPVVLVKVAFPGGPLAPQVQTDAQITLPPAMPAGWDQHVDALGHDAGDIIITKRQWGAFYGTDLELQLRRRGIDTIVLGGIATNFGVESTARQAWELGYAVVLAEDACASVSAELHAMAVTHVLPRIARIAQSQEIAFAAA